MIVNATDALSAFNRITADWRMIAVIRQRSELGDLRAVRTGACEFATRTVDGELPRARGVAPTGLGRGNRPALDL